MVGCQASRAGRRAPNDSSGKISPSLRIVTYAKLPKSSILLTSAYCLDYTECFLRPGWLSVRRSDRAIRPLDGRLMFRKNHLHLTATWVLLASFCATLVAQQPPRIRPLAPGVLTVIPVETEPEETFSGPVPIVEVVQGIPNLTWTPNFDAKSNTLEEKAKRAIFRRPVWNLEFAFKPLRMLEVDIPQPTGKMQRKLIWYMVYRVKNKGYALNPQPEGGNDVHGPHTTQLVNFATRRFFPHFVLRSQDFDKEYLDQIIPAAQAAIQKREKPGVRIQNSVEMTKIKIPLSDDRVDRSVWGVVTWEDVDPRIDYFSIYIRGLTNAFIFADTPGAYQPGDAPGKGRVFRFKTLQLNFWRPGDTSFEHEGEIRFGVPIDSDPIVQQEMLDRFGLEQRLDYRWIYR